MPLKFAVFFSKNVGGYRFLVKYVVFFEVLVCASHKEPIAVTDFDRLYFKNYFEF